MRAYTLHKLRRGRVSRPGNGRIISASTGFVVISSDRVGDGLPDIPLRFAMSGIEDADCVQMAAFVSKRSA